MTVLCYGALEIVDVISTVVFVLLLLTTYGHQSFDCVVSSTWNALTAHQED